MRISGDTRLSFQGHLMSKKVLVEFLAKRSGAKKHLKNLFFLKILCRNCTFYCSSLCLKGEIEKKEQDELDSHFKEKFTLDKKPHS